MSATMVLYKEVHLNKYREELLESHRKPDWDKTHGCFTVAKMVKRFNIKTMVDVGVCCGHTAAEVLALNQVEKYLMVDSWANDSLYFKVRNNFHDKAVEIYREDSMAAVKRIDDGCFDLVYVSGVNFKRTMEDLRGWYGKLKDGGILIGSGFNPPDSGVKQAVLKVFPKEIVNVNLGLDSNYWVFKE